ncbi:MAG: hypothetical protein CMJ28_00240 [Phycisphaerae bacterium]|nr:hypothetical protein [Phycisphaerae bacterium]
MRFVIWPRGKFGFHQSDAMDMNHDFLQHRDARSTGAFDYRTPSAQFRCREGVLSIRPVGPEFGVREEEVVLAELESCLQQVGRRLGTIALDMTHITTPKSHGLKFCFELSRRARRDHAKMSVRVGSNAWIDAFELLHSGDAFTIEFAPKGSAGLNQDNPTETSTGWAAGS